MNEYDYKWKPKRRKKKKERNLSFSFSSIVRFYNIEEFLSLLSSFYLPPHDILTLHINQFVRSIFSYDY
jgi:hypothetical protein